MPSSSILRRPEYTGSNRCWPCTAVNTTLVLVLALVVGVFIPLVGGFVLVAGTAAIVLRGYVVPYTPEFAPRIATGIPGGEHLFPDHGPERTPGGIGDADADGERIVAELLDAGILGGDEDLALTPDAAGDWWDAVQAYRNTPTKDLAPLVADAAPAAVRTRIYADDGRDWIILTDEDESLKSETWLSRPVAIADVATVELLTDHGIDEQTAADAAAPLRLFLDECPDCGGDIIETTGDGCCGGFGPGGPTHVLACADCRQRVATLD